MIADNLEALARALREWPLEAWRTVDSAPAEASGLFERLVARTAPAAVDPRRRARALESAEVVASVLRVLWPEAAERSAPRSDGDLTLAAA